MLLQPSQRISLEQHLFDVNLARIKALKRDTPREQSLVSARKGKLPWFGPYVNPKDRLSNQEYWGIHDLDVVDAYPLPDKDLREMLWWRTINYIMADEVEE